MLELRDYSKPELSIMFKTRDMQGLQRKLERYGVSFEVSGRGESAVFTINDIEDPFNIYCIVELDVDGRTDFKRLRDFYYCYFNDDEFMSMPYEVEETRMNNLGRHISRQTIANYISKLENKNLISRSTNEYIYYFAYKSQQTITDRTTYSQAWRQYWDDIEDGYCSFGAIYHMITTYSGVARKQAVTSINGIYLDEIEHFKTLIQQSIEKELDEQN